MIKIAFCDDEISVLNELRILLDQYRVERNQHVEYTAFQSPLELLAQIEKGSRFDILFLDVQPGNSGGHPVTICDHEGTCASIRMPRL